MVIGFLESKSNAEIMIGALIATFLFVNYSAFFLGSLSLIYKKSYFLVLLILITIIYFCALTGVIGISRFKLPMVPFYSMVSAQGLFEIYKLAIQKTKRQFLSSPIRPACLIFSKILFINPGDLKNLIHSMALPGGTLTVLSFLVPVVSSCSSVSRYESSKSVSLLKSSSIKSVRNPSFSAASRERPPVAATGQTISYGTGDDGDLQKGGCMAYATVYGKL